MSFHDLIGRFTIKNDQMAETTAKSEEQIGTLVDSFKNFWGPKESAPFRLEEHFQPYSKNETIGKVADWISSQDKRKNQAQILTAGIYAYIHEDEDDAFTTIDNSKPQKTQFQKNRQKYTASRLKREKERTQRTTNYRGNWGQNNYKNRRPQNSNRTAYRYIDRRTHNNYWFRKPSIIVRDTWKLIEEMEFAQLTKLRVSSNIPANDIYVAGSVMAYDKSFDYIQPREPIPLKPTTCIFPKVPTCEDPIIRENVSKATIFATDSILATLMSCIRSVAPWDIVIHRVANLIFFDKRHDSEIELLTVNETDSDPPFDQTINSPTALSLEATNVNQSYSQQCLLNIPRKLLEHPNPFFDPEESASIPSVGYKYRVFELTDGIKVMVRCEYEGYKAQNGGCINIKSLLEWSSKASVFGWREKLEAQRGSILATEIKNNSNKFAKWVISSLLCGDNLMKIGFISRNNFTSNKDHSILGSMEISPRDLGNQIGLNMDNAWGLLTFIVKKCMELPEGKYVLMKDPHKSSIRLYGVTDSTLNSEEDMDEDDDADPDAKQQEGADYLVFDDIY